MSTQTLNPFSTAPGVAASPRTPKRAADVLPFPDREPPQRPLKTAVEAPVKARDALALCMAESTCGF